MGDMDCKEARTYLVDRRRGTVPEERRALFEEHLGSCAPCRHESGADDALAAALAKHLSERRAPDRLRAALHERWGQRSEPDHSFGRPIAGPRRWTPGAAGVARTLAAMAAGAAMAFLVMVAWRARAPGESMVAEAVNDHLRVLYSEHPLGVESGGIHQVKPWFEGRLDFAPVVGFDGDEDFVLQGGAVGYFLDRRAATFVYKRRLHVITLFVFRAEGLSWPTVATRALGDAQATVSGSRGFHVLMWRRGDLGYALVSDVDERELTALGAKIARGG
jgi:anti-sigma factor RsiW